MWTRIPNSKLECVNWPWNHPWATEPEVTPRTSCLLFKVYFDSFDLYVEVSMWVCTCECKRQRKPKMLSSPELESQAVVLEIELLSCGRALLSIAEPSRQSQTPLRRGFRQRLWDKRHSYIRRDQITEERERGRQKTVLLCHTETRCLRARVTK